MSDPWGSPAPSDPVPPGPGPSPPPYSQSPYSQSPYSQSPYSQSPYSQSPYSPSPYGRPQLAPMGRRLLARMIDGVLLTVVLGVLAFALLARAASHVSSDPGTGRLTGMGPLLAASLLFAGLATALTLLYEVALIAVRGATLGKQLMGVRVLREMDGAVPGWGPAVLRWLIPFGAGFVCGLGTWVVYLSPLWDGAGRMQGWHDKVARTVVIRG